MNAEQAVHKLTSPNADRCARRSRVRARLAEAAHSRPELRIERGEPIREILRAYRSGVHAAPLTRYIAELRSEIEVLEAYARTIPRRQQSDGPSTRRALCFLKSFGRISALDFDPIPIEERPNLVVLLALEYRWCFAAAGTTQAAFKIAIGRTGAR